MPPRKKAKPPGLAPAAPVRREPEPIIETTTTKGGKRKDTVVGWQPHAQQPVIIGRNLERIEGARAAMRPCAVARRSGKKSITDVTWADEFDQPSDWEDAEEAMPVEKYESDVGWRAGPAKRELPPFKGHAPGPTDSTLTALSTPMEFVRTQLTGEFMQKCIEYTIAHAHAYRAADPLQATTSIERSMSDFEAHLRWASTPMQ